MTTFENGSTSFIPDKGAPAHEFDLLRPDFMRHVMGPLSHASVVLTIDQLHENFLSRIRGQRGTDIRKQVRTNADYHPERDMSALYMITHELSPRQEGLQAYPAWELLTNRQKNAAQRFVSIADKHATESSINDFLFESSVFEVTDTVASFSKSHPELELTDSAHMVSFLRDPHLLISLRNLAGGGFGFMANLKHPGGHPAVKPWAEDPKKPILDTSGTYPRTTHEIKQAARTHRRMNEQMSYDQLEEYGVFGSGLRYSSGCPALYMTFRTDIPDLVSNDLSLSSRQVAQLMTGDNPVVAALDDNHYRVMRDSYKTAANVLADALEIIASK